VGVSVKAEAKTGQSNKIVNMIKKNILALFPTAGSLLLFSYTSELLWNP
jgi:hypothetical protein